MKTSRPLAITMPPAGVVFAESAHTGDFHMAPRTDPFHKLLYVLRGGVTYAEGARQPETAAVGALLVIPAGVEHQLRDERPSTLLLLCVAPAFLRGEPELPALWGELAGRGERRLALSRPSQLHVESAWRRAMIEGLHRRPGVATLHRALAAQILVTLVRLPARQPASDPRTRVAAVARELETTFYDEWNLDRAAVRAGVSRRHFSALFRATCGRTFWEHLTELRLTHAAQLLRQGGHSVTGVVFSCGFGDVSQFYRLFRARYQLPPREWAVAARG
jgi:AraC-like DNA-binding protein/mannose-6-phosphate isomerase-like protein (cupin superfamily)